MFHQLDLTIAIPVKNEEINLPRCLAAIGSGFAKNIVIIDSGSTDKTKTIANEWGAKVINFDWDGKFPKKRNWFLRNHTPKTKWVMFIDADEYLTNDFKEEACKKLEKNNKDGYWLSYTIHFLGKPLKGGYPLRKLALFKTGAAEYERIEEDNWSHLDMEVHEHPILKNTDIIYSKIDHQDFRGISHYALKHNEYASWESSRFLKLLPNKSTIAQLTWKQKFKYRLLRSAFIGPAYFFGNFILLGGFRDGARGLAFAILKMAYFTQVYCKIKEGKTGPSAMQGVT